MESSLPKLIAIVGPTASGKSALAVAIAQAWNGELVCADSRQLYRGMTIGTAKDDGVWVTTRNTRRVYVLTSGVTEHLVDVLDPQEEWSVAEYQKRAYKTIDDILARGRLPILVGGTGLYVQAVIDHLQFPDVAPNETLRERLQFKSLEELQRMYAACDPVGAASIDDGNKRRLIRAIEVCLVTKQPYSVLRRRGAPRYETLQLGIELYRESLYQRINDRVVKMVQGGLIEEVQTLMKTDGDVTRGALTGIGYREVIDYLQGETSVPQMIRDIQTNTRQLAKRQLTWFKRDARIAWVVSHEEAFRRVRAFLSGDGHDPVTKAKTRAVAS
ncbi:tRNA (adenosine(37)-N6)-dimethylallyltransferase MiaA [Candidatus Uhrbacteria bacterium]|nr:tRNA (adenosine(37)-N6)-dimethylallyltransferase MiaA [Candidatus Uhrbacteria bacterium]